MEQTIVQQLDQVIEAQGSASLQGGLLTLEDGSVFDLTAVKLTILELMQSNMKMIEEYKNGNCYDTKNPYRRECVIAGLRSLGKVLDVSDILRVDNAAKAYLAQEGHPVDAPVSKYFN